MSRSAKTSPPASARLFQETPEAPPSGVHTASIDGASRGNPGPAAYAAILRGPDGSRITGISKCIGRETNNVAEYHALIAALDYAAAHSIAALRVRSDSELLVRQMQGRYKVKSAELKPLHERAQKLARGFRYFVIEHVPREQNRGADALANAALDSRHSGAESGVRPATRAAAHFENSPDRTRVRAEYRGGVFVPSVRVGLPEGSTVELEIHPLRRT